MTPTAPILSGSRNGSDDLPPWVSDNRNAVPFGKACKRRRGLRKEHAAAGDDHRLLAPCAAPRPRPRVRARPGATRRGGHRRSVEEAFGIVIGLGLHVLAEGQRHRPAFGRIGQHRHGAVERRDQLLGPRDAVEIARHRPEAVIDATRAVAEILDLLQHRIGQAVGEDIAGQQQHRQAVDMGDRRGRHHVGGAGADRGGAGHHAAAAHRLGEGDRRMRHRLLIVGAIGRQFVAHAIERLADARDIAMAEDRPDAGEDRQLLAVDLGHLAGEEARQAPAPWSGGWSWSCHVSRSSQDSCSVIPAKLVHSACHCSDAIRDASFRRHDEFESRRAPFLRRCQLDQIGEALRHVVDRRRVVDLAGQPGFRRLAEDRAADGEALDARHGLPPSRRRVRVRLPARRGPSSTMPRQ